MWLTFAILAGHLTLVDGHIWTQDILHEHLEAFLLLGAELLEDGARLGTGLEVALMARQLYPWIALLLVRLKEGRPLHYVSYFAPARALWKDKETNKSISINWIYIKKKGIRTVASSSDCCNSSSNNTFQRKRELLALPMDPPLHSGIIKNTRR